MGSLNWGQVNVRRLAQHYLLQRADRQNVREVVTRIGGVQAQLMSAAELSLWARVDGPLCASACPAWGGRRGPGRVFRHGDTPFCFVILAAKTGTSVDYATSLWNAG
jgi:hypothetical protein